MNNNINPILYAFYRKMRQAVGARIVHRRSRKSKNCIEIILTNNLLESVTCRLNTLKEAEACGYWVICRRQNKRGHSVWRGKAVFQLFLSPVHPKKQAEARKAIEIAAQQQNLAQQVSFEPIFKEKSISHLHNSKKSSIFAGFLIGNKETRYHEKTFSFMGSADFYSADDLGC